MSPNVKVIQELGRVTGPRTVEEQLDALHEAQTFLSRLLGDKAVRPSPMTVDEQIIAIQEARDHLAHLLAAQAEQAEANGTPSPAAPAGAAAPDPG